MLEVGTLNNVQPVNSYYKTQDTLDAKEENTELNKKIEEKNYDEKLKKSVDKLNKFIDDEGAYAEISTHDKFKHDIIIKIIDKQTKEVIMEVPPKKILDMVAKMCEIAGVMFDKKAW